MPRHRLSAGYLLAILLLSPALSLSGCASNPITAEPRRDSGPDTGSNAADSGPRDSGPPDDDGDGVPNERDCDPSDPGAGASAERSCAGDCGSGLERCAEGVWGACDAPTGAACECSPGATRELPCERCGVQRQTCSGGGTWETTVACEGAGPCSPGDLEMEIATPCAGAGRRTRACTESCTWGDFACDEGPAQLWFFPSGGGGSTGWTRFSYGGGPNAPRAPVRAAISVADGTEAYVMTDATFHVLSLTSSPPTWVRTGPLGGAGQLPEVVAAGGQILFAWSLNEGFFGRDPAGESLAVVVDLGGGGTVSFSYGYDSSTRRFTRDPAQEMEYPGGGGRPCCDWTGEPGVSPLTPSQIRGQWVDDANLDRWTDTCPASATSHGYLGSLSTTSEVAVQPICTNLSFSERIPAASFEPLGRAGAPPLASIGAAVWSSGLYLFAETP